MNYRAFSMRTDMWSIQRQELHPLIGGLDGRLLIAVGVGSGMEARQLHYSLVRLIEDRLVPDFVGGFVFFVSGYLCSAFYGLPDLGFILRSEIAKQVDVIEQATWMAALDTRTQAFPIGVDIDTGYGNEPAAVILTCRQVHKQGAQYVQIEDQYSINKSCGHMDGAAGAGKRLLSAEEMLESRLLPAVSFAKDQDDLLVMARTDALAVLGYDEALRRARLYAGAGADFIFVEAPETWEQLRQVPEMLADLDALCVANMIEGSSKTPYCTPRALHDMGYDVALYCVGSLLTARRAQERYYDLLGRGDGINNESAPDLNEWFSAFNRVIGREQTENWNRMFRSITEGSWQGKGL